MATPTKSSAKLLPVLDIGYASHVGGRRDADGHEASNEDSIAIHPAAKLLKRQRRPRAIVLVADGMGGGSIGRTLSSHATVAAIETLREDSADSPEQQLKKAFALANHSLVTFKNLRPEHFTDGGSTLVAALILRQKSQILVHIGNIGDSRAYLLKTNTRRLEQLTRDHNQLQYLIKEQGLSLEQARLERGVNGLTHRLGRSDNSLDNAPEFYRNIPFQAGDRLMLCTDGLSGLLDYEKVSEQEIVNILQKNSASKAADKLINLALQRKTADNVSVAVIQYGQANFWGWLPAISWQLIVGLLLILLLIPGFFLISNSFFNQTSTHDLVISSQANPATVTPLTNGEHVVLLTPNTVQPGQPTSTFDVRTATPTATQTPSPTPIPPTRIPPTRIPPTQIIPNLVPTGIPTNTLIPPTKSPEPNDPEPSDPVPGDPVPGDPVPGDPVPGDPVPGDPEPSDPVPGDPVPGDPVPGDPVPGDPVPGDPSQP